MREIFLAIVIILLPQKSISTPLHHKIIFSDLGNVDGSFSREYRPDDQYAKIEISNRSDHNSTFGEEKSLCSITNFFSEILAFLVVAIFQLPTDDEYNSDEACD